MDLNLLFTPSIACLKVFWQFLAKLWEIYGNVEKTSFSNGKYGSSVHTEKDFSRVRVWNVAQSVSEAKEQGQRLKSTNQRKMNKFLRSRCQVDTSWAKTLSTFLEVVLYKFNRGLCSMDHQEGIKCFYSYTPNSTHFCGQWATLFVWGLKQCTSNWIASKCKVVRWRRIMCISSFEIWRTYSTLFYVYQIFSLLFFFAILILGLTSWLKQIRGNFLNFCHIWFQTG